MRAVGILDQPATDRPGAAPVRSIALPVEHGGWGFTLEPILLGLLIAPTLAGVGIAIAALGAFLMRRPLRLVLVDRVRGRWLPRTTIARRFVGLYTLLGGSGLAVAASTAAFPFWPAICAGLAPAAYALWADAHSQSRKLAAELAGAVAMAVVVAAIALAAGRGVAVASGLWLVLACRDAAAIMLVRSQLKQLRDKPAHPTGVYATQAGVLLAGCIAAVAGVVPWLSVLALAGHGIYAVATLRGHEVDREARIIGWTQMGIGFGVVGMTALGVTFGW